jgi:hypothetical protein
LTICCEDADDVVAVRRADQRGRRGPHGVAHPIGGLLDALGRRLLRRRRRSRTGHHLPLDLPGDELLAVGQRVLERWEGVARAGLTDHPVVAHPLGRGDVEPGEDLRPVRGGDVPPDVHRHGLVQALIGLVVRGRVDAAHTGQPGHGSLLGGGVTGTPEDLAERPALGLDPREQLDPLRAEMDGVEQDQPADVRRPAGAEDLLHGPAAGAVGGQDDAVARRLGGELGHRS